MNSKITNLALMLSSALIFANTPAFADDFTGKFTCTLGAYDQSHQWQVKTDVLVVTHSRGSLTIAIANTTATVDYGMSGEGPLISAQLKDSKSGFRSSTDLEVNVAEISVGLYDDNATDGGATAQLDCDRDQ